MSVLSKVVGWFTGGGKTVEKVVDMADKAIDTQQERSERDGSDIQIERTSCSCCSDDTKFVAIDGASSRKRYGSISRNRSIPLICFL